MSAAIETHELSKRYRRVSALSECTVAVPEGRVCALVGPNGAGKTTLLRLLAGLASPTGGTALVLGGVPRQDPAFLAEVGFLAQEITLYRRFTSEDHIRIGAHLNPSWDAALVRTRLAELRIPLDQRVGTLAPGQRAHGRVQRDVQPAQPVPDRIAVPSEVHVRADADVVLGGHPLVQRDLLGEEPDFREEGRVLARRAAEDRGLAASRARQPGQQPQQRGLARAVRPDQRGYPALGNRDGTIGQRGDAAVPLGQRAGFDGGGHAISSSAAARSVTRSSDSIDSSSSPAARAPRTQRARLRPSRV